MRNVGADEIDALLPQTQCGLCGYGGCMPYAKAIASDAAPLNLCPPGGCQTLQALGTLLNEDVSPYLAEMTSKQKHSSLAVIREEECIGCTKCIQACPVDAIIGSAKQMHTVLPDYCTGCELCVPACPVDCIDMVAAPEPMQSEKKAKANFYRELYIARQKRLAQSKLEKRIEREKDVYDRKQYILAAIARSKLKRK